MKKTRKQKPTSEISSSKRRLFTVITFLIPIFFFVLLEMVLRCVNYGPDFSLFVPTPTETSPYLGINTDIGRRYFTNMAFSPTPRKDLFLKQKPQNGYRIFVLGGSTAAGFPYGNNLTFPRILHRRLADTFPDKHIEVVNCALTAVNSYTLLDFTGEILQQQPDLIIVYAGHNEYYGAMGAGSMASWGRQRWLVRLLLYLRRLKMFILFSDILVGSGSRPQQTGTETLMTRIVANKEIAYGSPTYRRGIEQFSANLRAIVSRARAKNVPVLLTEVVSNIRDHPPFVSIKTPAHPPAQDIFFQARQAEQKGDFSKAQKLYERAKDLDALRFRAPEDINLSIQKIARAFGVTLVPVKKYFKSSSPNGLIGDNLFCEHLHPNRKGYFFMSEAIFRTLYAEKYVSKQWPVKNIKPLGYYYENWGFTALDSVYAALNIAHLKAGWPFKPPGTRNTFLQDFKPETREEALVLEVLGSETAGNTLENAHLKLAAELEEQGRFQQALHEYKALTYIVPALDLFYQPYIRLLIQIKDYQQALQVLYDAKKYQDTAFPDKWIGQIYLVTGETQKGIRFLEESLKKDADDLQVLFNLCRACYLSGMPEKGDELFLKLADKIGGSPELEELAALRGSAAGGKGH